MAKSTYLAKKTLDHNLGVAAYAMPTVYLGLFTSLVGLADGSLLHEIAGGGYARQAVSFAAAVDDMAGGKSLSDEDVLFPPATADWGLMVGWAIMDAQAAGNILYWGEMPKYGDPADYKRVFSGDRFFVRAEEFSQTEA